MIKQLLDITTKKTFLFVSLLFVVGLKSFGENYYFLPLSGGPSVVYCSLVYNGELYVGGSFTTAGGITANRIAKWNGSDWSTLGTGLNGVVNAMVIYNGELYVGGSFTTAGGTACNNIAKWDGINWSALGVGVDNGVKALVTYTGELFVAGYFSNAGGISAKSIAKWDGSSWSLVGTGPSNPPSGGFNYMTVYNSKIYLTRSVANFIDTWDGVAWAYIQPPINLTYIGPMEVYNNKLYVGHSYSSSSGILTWDGSSFSYPMNGNNSNTFRSMVVFNGELFVGGDFTTAGGISVNYVGKMNGTFWSAVGSGTNLPVYNLNVFNNDLYVATGSGIFRLFKPAIEPTAISTNIIINNIATNSLTVNWTNGNGNKHLVVGKAGSAVNQSPIDTMTYNTASSFGTGSDLGSGNYVVYGGTGNTVTVTNLTPDVIYHFAVYEYNDSSVTGYENYLISSFATANHTTIASEPTVATNQISFSNANFTSMNVSLNPGNGIKRIVVAKQGSAVNTLPADTFSYNASSFFGTANTDMGGGNYVVYDGTGNSFNLTGLTANTIYHFASFEYNGSTIPANNYITSNPAIGYQSTLTTEPTTPSTNIQFTNVKDSSMTLSWTVGNGQRRMVVAATSVVTSIPVDGVDHLAKDTFGLGADLGFNNYVVYSGTSNTFNLKGLMPDITYHFAVFEYSGTNTSNNYLLMNPAIGSKSTLIAEPDVPASNLTLSPITNGITTVNWTNGNGVSRIAVVRQGMPINILPDDGNSYTANAVFGSGQDLGQGNFICYVGNSNTFNLQGLDPLNVYYVGIIEYNGSGGGTNYMLNNFPIADNLPAEPTVLSGNMSFSDLTSSSVKVSWTNGDGSYRLLLAKENAPVSKSPVDGAVYVANSVFGSGADLGMANFAVYNGIGNSAVITNLNEGSTYHFSLFEFNKDASGPANYLDSALDGNISILTRIQQNATEKTFEIYPNPSKGEFMVEIQNTKGGLQDAKIVITNILGETIYQSPVATGPGPSKTFIDLSSYSSGIFNLQLISTQGILTTKIVLE